MVDIFDEVEEDLRAERAEKLLKKYAWLIVALAVGVVAAAAGWQLWNRYQARQDVAAAVQYMAADGSEGLLCLSEQGQTLTPGQQMIAPQERYPVVKLLHDRIRRSRYRRRLS